jgi:hypothetical protein
MLRHLRDSLKADGRLVLLEQYRKEDPTIPIRPEHKMSVAEAKPGWKSRPKGSLCRRLDESLPSPAYPSSS